MNSCPVCLLFRSYGFLWVVPLLSLMLSTSTTKQLHQAFFTYFLQGDSQTEAFRCIEMQEGRAWGWGVDAFGVCSTIHCLLFGEYMQVEKTISPQGICLPVLSRESDMVLEVLHAETCPMMHWPSQPDEVPSSCRHCY